MDTDAYSKCGLGRGSDYGLRLDNRKVCLASLIEDRITINSGCGFCSGSTIDLDEGTKTNELILEKGTYYKCDAK